MNIFDFTSQEMFELEVTSNSSENEEVSSEDEEVTKHMYENPGSASCPQIKVYF